ncbi:hypothetical protein CZP2022_248 [Vibrio phage C-ZP2022]|nr:hypothetical protein CZP2022_248 [Vibrio phage C-ZP2022]
MPKASLKLRQIPFNISLLDNSRGRLKTLLPVRSLSTMDHLSSDFQQDGLYSTLIFGQQGTPQRDKRRSYIDLKVPVFNPIYFKELKRLKSLYTDIILGREYAVWDEKEKDFVRSKEGILDGQTGFSFFLSHFNELEFKQGESKERQLRIEVLEEYRSVALVDFLPVLPAGLRDVQFDEASGRPVEEEIGPLYRKAISATNAIPVGLDDKNSPLFDGPRRSVQIAINGISEYIINILAGKKGFLSGKFGSRRVFGTTRNVLTSMETGSEFLGDVRQPDLSTTINGLFQFMKGVEPILALNKLPKGFLADFIENIDQTVSLINRDTWKAEDTVVSPKQRDKWGTKQGREKLINGFKNAKSRHKPIMVDGYYLKLIYRDDKYFKVMNSIDELPEGYPKENVSPMTWVEMFYLHCAEIMPNVRVFNTRYPVTGLGSNYPSEIYIKSTNTGYRLKQLDDNWAETDNEVLEYPKPGMSFYESMAVHPSFLSGLGADFDLTWDEHIY